jgi:hypothetical protein
MIQLNCYSYIYEHFNLLEMKMLSAQYILSLKI